MKEKALTLQEIEDRRQQLNEELRDDELAVLMGLMGKPEMIERTVRREVERRWLHMEALLLRSKKRSNILH